MRSSSLTGWCLLSLFMAHAPLTACGSDDSKTRSRPNGGGEGGSDAGSGNGNASGDFGIAGDAGAGSMLPSGGAGGMGATDGAGAEPNGSGAGGEGGAGNVSPFHGLYISEDGDDAATGTAEAPFATLAHAASVAQAGDTVVFMDGSYSVGAPTVIPDGVDLMAENAGAVTLLGNLGPLLTLAGDTHLTGLTFQSYSKVVQFEGAALAQGTVTIQDVGFINCSATCLELTGAARAVVTSQDGFVLGNGGGAFATLAQTASLSITGGVLQNYGSGGILRATDETTVELTDLEVSDGTGKVLSLAKQAKGTVTGVTVATLSSTLFEQADSSELIVESSDLSIKPNATEYHCFLVTATNKLSITGSKLHGCGTGIKGAVPIELTLIDTEFYDLSFGGSDLDTGGGGNPGGRVVIDGCDFRDVTYTAMRLGGPGSLLDVQMRNTVIDVTTLANWGGVIINGSSASTIDLGTLAEPGENTFLQRAATQTALQLNLQGVTVLAVGNTWTPNQQGANAQGNYVVQAGKVYEVTAAVTSGINFVKPHATTTLRLAQIP